MWGGWVSLWPVYTACLSYYYVFKNPYHLHYSDCAGSWCPELYGDSFVKVWALEGQSRVAVPYVFSSRCIRYVHDAIYSFSCRVCRYDLYVRFCDGNSFHAVAEYQQRFPNRRIPTRRVFTRVYQSLWDTGLFPEVRIASERNVNEGVDEEEGNVQTI